MMDYEKAYKAVLQTATQWIKGGCTDKEKICLECVFPQLRESESDDERIRKGLIKLLTVASEAYLVGSTGIKKDSYLSYLEKQKEQKPTSFNEPYNPDEYEVVMEGNATSLKRKEQKQETISISEMVSKYRTTDEYDVDGNYMGKPVNCMIRAYEQGIRDTLLKIKEQKPAEWSEEDEAIVKFYEDDCNCRINNMSMKDVIEMRQKFKDWVTNRIKSLRPQPKQEWSEEDETTIQATIELLKVYFKEDDLIGLSNLKTAISPNDLVNRLKSLRPSWKPSEEQIYTLERICSNLHLRASDDAPKLDEIIELFKQK